MDFSKQKQDILSRADKSRKAAIDEKIADLVDLINSLPDYYTSSSCSGRIFLIGFSPERKKNEAGWLFAKHSEASFDEIKSALTDIPEDAVWFRQESFILHICCSSIEAAERMLSACHDAGLKRAGIIALGKRTMIECFGTEKIESLVAENGRLIVTDDYLKTLIEHANSRHRKNLSRIERLYKEIRKIK